MKRLECKSPQAKDAINIIVELQNRFVTKLSQIAEDKKERSQFEKVEWFRDEGIHGGGVRFVAPKDSIFNRGSVNMSQVHYDDIEDKKLSSANALSTIIHPKSPIAPSVHMHFSLTEMKDGSLYWRVMADLNPSIINESHKDAFDKALKKASGEHYEYGTQQGDRYFNIPDLKRHRGVSHFYLESFQTENPVQDRNFAKSFAETMIDTYCKILAEALKGDSDISKVDRQKQIDYHSLYFYQVLTLDRGTTSGLMIHQQNDVGTLGSLPSHVDRELLKSWVVKTTKPQDQLLESLIQALPEQNPSPIDESCKAKLAQAIREHYKSNPKALELQARGNIIPPTVANHK